MKRLTFVGLCLLAYGVVLLLAWTFGPKLFELPVMTLTWVMIIGLALLLGIPCGIFRVLDLRCFQREQRMARNLCVRCGYDLRASTDSCPECGTPISITNERRT